MLGDYLAQVLPDLRAHAKSQMTDTVTITRPGATTTDPATGVPDTDGALVYTGKAKLQADATLQQTSEVGTAVQTITRGSVHLPVGAALVKPGDLVILTGSATRPDLVGARSRIAQPMPAKTWATADRHNLESG